MIILYRIYQLLIMAPLLIVVTVIAATFTIVGSMIGVSRTMGYWPGHIWARIFCWLSLVRVSVRRETELDSKTSYVFVANHQGAYDIFAIYGYLGHNFRWMMKKALERIPLVGYACRVAGNIYVDNSSPSAVRATMAKAETQLRGGMSVVVFPEGSRSSDGKMHPFRRGAFKLAEEFSLPVVPITIDGSYDIMPRRSLIPRYGHIILTIHAPIYPAGANNRHDMDTLITRSYNTIASSL